MATAIGARIGLAFTRWQESATAAATPTRTGPVTDDGTCHPSAPFSTSAPRLAAASAA